MSWITDEDKALVAADEASCMRKRVEQEETSLVPSETAVATRLALATADRLAQLKALRAQHAACAMPAAATLVDREIKQVSRSLHAGGREESRAAADKLRAHMDSVMSKELELLRCRQTKARKQRAAQAKAKAKQRKVEKVKKFAKKAKAALKKKLDDLPVRISAGDCNKVGRAGTHARSQCLERLKLRAPALPFELEAVWQHTRDAYAEAEVLRAEYRLKPRKSVVGPELIKEINEVLSKLREHYKGPNRFNQKGETGGDENAFLCFVQRMAKRVASKLAATVALM